MWILFSALAGALFATPAWSSFYWGVGNAAFQVEGSPQPSDWSAWTHTPGKIADGTNADTATDFWNHPEKDFALAQELGATMFRLSVAWERIEPQRGVWDEAALARYEKMLVQLRAHGLEPLVTLHHFVVPAWLAQEGGLLAPTFAEDFAVFAEKVVGRLSQAPARVQWWMTFNEPMVVTYANYVVGEWPPGKKDDLKSAMRAAANMAHAHLRALARLAPVRQERGLKFSIAAHVRDFQGLDRGPLNRVLAELSDWSFNRQFINAITTGRIFFWTPGSEFIWEREPLPQGGPALDYLGFNYYGRTLVGLKGEPPYIAVKEGPGPRTDVDWEIYPEGLGHVIHDLYKAYKLPLLISENGIADAADRNRGDFLKSHTAQVIQARRDGIPVLGYLHWSLTDNFEWAKGFSARFGLVEMDYANGARRPRPSFEVYKQIIKDN